MRKSFMLLATTALVTGVAAPAQAAPGPTTVDDAWIAVDTNRIGILDAGDVLKIRFSRAVMINDITSVTVRVVGDNGAQISLADEGAPYGAYFTVKGRTVTLTINLIPEEYVVEPLTYPLLITGFSNISSKRGATDAVSAGGDVWID